MATGHRLPARKPGWQSRPGDRAAPAAPAAALSGGWGRAEHNAAIDAGGLAPLPVEKGPSVVQEMGRIGEDANQKTEDCCMNTYACKNQVSGKGPRPGADARRSKGKAHHPRKGATPKAASKRGGTRLETHGGVHRKASDVRRVTPGSDAARLLGCVCPVADNGRGAGYMGIPGIFVFSAGCPVHPWKK